MYLCQLSLSPEIGLYSISKLLGRIVDVLILVISGFFFILSLKSDHSQADLRNLTIS